jgi:hypothetical protein
MEHGATSTVSPALVTNGSTRIRHEGDVGHVTI